MNTFFLGVNESALRFLAEVSAADGVAVECNQTTISNRLLLNDSMLMLKTEINANAINELDSTILLEIAAKSNNKIQKWESIVDEKDFFEKDGGLIMGKYKAKESVHRVMEALQLTFLYLIPLSNLFYCHRLVLLYLKHPNKSFF